MIKKRKKWKIYLPILILIILIAAIYFTFFYYYKCETLSCFQEHQKECARTKYINDASDATWGYFINGKDGDNCVITTELIHLKTGTLEKQNLEGKNMKCYLPLGKTTAPESDLFLCHGLLKEDLQNMIIQRLHKHIIENIGEIAEELNKVI
jgi:hypothetical protein